MPRVVLHTCHRAPCHCDRQQKEKPHTAWCNTPLQWPTCQPSHRTCSSAEADRKNSSAYTERDRLEYDNSSKVLPQAQCIVTTIHMYVGLPCAKEHLWCDIGNGATNNREGLCYMHCSTKVTKFENFGSIRIDTELHTEQSARDQLPGKQDKLIQQQHNKLLVYNLLDRHLSIRNNSLMCPNIPINKHSWLWDALGNSQQGTYIYTVHICISTSSNTLTVHTYMKTRAVVLTSKTHKQVLWWHSPVYNPVVMQIHQSMAQVPHGHRSVTLLEVLALHDGIEEVATLHST